MSRRPSRPLPKPTVARARQVDPPFEDPPYQWTPYAEGGEDLTGAPSSPRRNGGEALECQPDGGLPSMCRLHGFGLAVAEVLAQRRPPRTLANRMTERAYAEMLRLGAILDPHQAPATGTPRVQHPRQGVIEICLTIVSGDRAHALAMRLEREGTRWVCVTLECH
ncbi:Rv3235 family protein [Sinosporangium siamense]|uniref:Uncharacterized protein n=1 Tax=Sinosporangium siamense TaxID=1367973 RepID=A0A919RCC8_9ACTN|nr:Rv3235 family protein [Sinosporangium siamense]GII91058.1 hypothetical protein Ssi02_12890 [Sinosporangium siamense]